MNALSGVAALTAASVTATTAVIGSSHNLPATNRFSSEALISTDSMYNSVAVDLGSLLINGSLLNDSSLLADIINGNETISGNATSSNMTATEDVGELIRMAATSVILGLMILITIIGKFLHIYTGRGFFPFAADTLLYEE